MRPHIMVFNQASATLILFAALLRGQRYHVTTHVFAQAQRNIQHIEAGHPQVLILEHLAR